MTSLLKRGLLAGAAGTAVLNAVTYADMAVRGREASEMPERAVEQIAETLGTQVEGAGRVTALGALVGTASGLAIGVAAAAARSAGVRLPASLEALAIGAGAMAATNGPAAVLGLTDPRTWTAEDWMSDAVPHLGYGVAAAALLRATDEAESDVRPAGAGLLLRSALLGVAAGCRSSIGVAAPTLRFSDSRPTQLAVLASVAGEFLADQSSSVPARNQPQGAAPRFVTAVLGARALARQRGCNVVLPALLGGAGAAVGIWGGLAWREWASTRMPDRQAALIEDAVALALGLGAAR